MGLFLFAEMFTRMNTWFLQGDTKFCPLRVRSYSLKGCLG